MKARKIIAILLLLTVFVQAYPAEAASQSQIAVRSTNTIKATLSFKIKSDGTSSEVVTVMGKSGTTGISGGIQIYKLVKGKEELLHVYHIATSSDVLHDTKYYKFVQSGTYICKLHVNVFRDNIAETVHMERQATY